jgi:hypothetical protein
VHFGSNWDENRLESKPGSHLLLQKMQHDQSWSTTIVEDCLPLAYVTGSSGIAIRST